MVNFSLFPTAYWADERATMRTNALASQPAIVWERGNSPFFPFLPKAISWQQLHRLIQQTIFSFQQLGIQPQQIIAYSGSSRLCCLVAYCAAIAMNARILMLNPAMAATQQQQLRNEYPISFFLTDQHFADFSLKQTACHQEGKLDLFQPATLTLTSGSSGLPKLVAHSVQNHLENAMGVCELMAFECEHAWLFSLPLFHVSGQGIIWRWLLKGASLYINEDKEDFYRLLSQVSHASLVPTQLQRYLALPSENIALQQCLLGGTAIPAELVQQAQKRGMVTYSGYGMTEMASTICAKKNALDSVGMPLKGREVKIVEQEIWVRGAGLALGYLQKNGKIQPLVNAEGWLQTKDRGMWNTKQELVVQGRLDNMFISGGENIQPEDIEKLIYQSGLVEQVFILPIEDLEFGQRPVAILQLNEPHSHNSEFQRVCNQIKIWLSNRIEKFKQPIAYFPLEIERYQQQGTIKISRQQLLQDLPTLLGKKA